ncbi:hypothetical protein BpHYR1_023761 [Brachionus plicatilis]|uniref:Uncharacterized protein n=1 Tax=Brachionus plicatilis TaxID=10195 RepID=A0A3M7SN40_BRAPC|nr:hypothetical protein BpHYR1_023761 [Brachionus plicatilis]
MKLEKKKICRDLQIDRILGGCSPVLVNGLRNNDLISEISDCLSKQIISVESLAFGKRDSSSSRASRPIGLAKNMSKTGRLSTNKQVHFVNYPAEESAIQALGHGISGRLAFLERILSDNCFTPGHNAALSNSTLQFFFINAQQLGNDYQGIFVDHMAFAVNVDTFVMHKCQISQV